MPTDELATARPTGTAIGRLLIEQLAQPACILDGRGHVMAVNEPLTRMLAVATQAATSGDVPIDELLSTSTFAPAIRRITAGGCDQQLVQHLGSDGHATQTFVTAFVDPGSAARGILCIWRRESEMPGIASGVLGLDLESRLARCESDLQAFAYIASHDLQEPLRTISNSAEVLHRRVGAQLDERSRSFLEFTIDAAYRMAALLEALLQFSRVGTDVHAWEDVELGAVVAEATAQLDELIRTSGARVVAVALPAVHGNRDLLRQAFVHLIDNALKFRGEAPPNVRISATREARRWVIEVADNGMGIPHEFHERVFGIFKRLHSRLRYPGGGAGLAIVRRIIERHGGSIAVLGSTPQGTTFRFSLPAALASLAEARP